MTEELEAKRVYDEFKDELEEKYPDKAIAIDVGQKIIAGIGDTPQEAFNDAEKKHGYKPDYFIMMVGWKSPYQLGGSSIISIGDVK